MNLLRAEQQAVGHREVTLQWSLCRACRHVRLEHWRVAEVTAAGRGAGPHPPQR